ncbi:MAG: hypothetical protein QNI95_07450 [Desulfobacterales bacterium]|nr:hypothetical protein [Desulfobacterales bacterium]
MQIDQTPSTLPHGRLASTMARLHKKHILILGRLAGGLMYYLSHRHRNVAIRNLQFVHPDWSTAKIHKFAKKVFGNFGITFFEMLQMKWRARDEILKSILLEGDEHVLRALEQKRGLIIISAHFGNWESALQLYPLYFNRTILGVVQSFEYEFMDRWIHGFRTRFGNRFIHKKGAMDVLTKTLRQNGIVALMIDMTRQKQGVPVKFLGHRATATPAAALLALRCKSPVIPNFCYRQPDGRLISRFKYPVPIARTNNLRADLQANTQTMTNIIEQTIRRNPDQWHWMQKRWKAFYPDLYPEYFAARKRYKAEKKKRRKMLKAERDVSQSNNIRD